MDDLFKMIFRENIRFSTAPQPKGLNIVDVIFNEPATIVMWDDGTKTVVKCDPRYDVFDKEKGLAMAIAKRVSGNKGSFNDLFRKWCE